MKLQSSNFKVRQAFSLLEVMVSMAVLGILILILSEVTSRTRDVTATAIRRIETFKETRAAFEAMARRAGQATLNSYWGYDNPSNPTRWMRQSELHFATLLADPSLSDPEPTVGHALFFQAPFGYAGSEASSTGDASLDHLDGLLNGWGFYVEYNSDLGDRTPFLSGETAAHPERRRLRLMELRIPSEDLTVMVPPPGSPDGLPEISTETTKAGVHGWFTDPAIRAKYARPIAENVLALIVSPRIPDGVTVEGDASFIAPNYSYDSRLHQYLPGDARAKIIRHQLPLALDLTLIATDELSWQLYEAIQGDTAAEDLAAEINARFTTVADYETDLEELELWMREHKLKPRVFRIAISIRAAKFTTEIDA